MKTWEMIKALTENPEKKFKGKILGQAELYEGILVWSSSMEDVVISNTLLKMEWEEVKEPVNFMDVVRESNNKSIRFEVEHDLFIDHATDRKFTLSVFLDYISHEYISSDAADILLNGKFYIED